MNVKTSNMSCRNMFKSEAVLDNVTQLAMNFLLCVRITFVCHAICCHKHSCIFCLLPYYRSKLRCKFSMKNQHWYFFTAQIMKPRDAVRNIIILYWYKCYLKNKKRRGLNKDHNHAMQNTGSRCEWRTRYVSHRRAGSLVRRASTRYFFDDLKLENK